MRHVWRRGFTLIELLVVIGMIVLLATILLPMLSRVQSQARRTAMAGDLQVISEALEAYKHDFGNYPRIDRNQNPNLPPMTGAALLCWALVAPGPANSQQIGQYISPGDGADGPGFRLRGTTGPVKGPYLPPDRFLIGTPDGMGIVHQPGTVNPNNVSKAMFDNAEDVLADRNSSPILYFEAALQLSTTAVYIGVAGGVFAFADNREYLDVTHAGAVGTGPTTLMQGCGNPANLTRGTNGNPSAGARVMGYRMGDINCNGIIDNGEVPLTTGPYLLWSAGPDQVFGSEDDVMSDGTQLQPTPGPLPFNIQPH